MSRRNLILLLVAALIAGFTAIAVRKRIQPTAMEVGMIVPKPEIRVLAAKRDIQAGSFVKAGIDIDWMVVKEENVQPSHIRSDSENLGSFEGAVARRTIRVGEAVPQGILVKPGAGGFLSAVLEPGRRAMSIAVNPTSGNAGFVSPGDRVDLMVTHKVKVVENSADSSGNEDQAVITETFIEDVRVVAVDQMLDNPENKPILAKTITVEVAQKQAEKIAVATELGTVAVVLRSLSDETKKAENPDAREGFVETLSAAGLHEPSVTRDVEVSGALSRKGDTNPRVRVFRGNEMQSFEFYRDTK